MIQKIRDYFYEINLLIRSVPTVIFTLFILSVFSMNLLANKSINLPFDFLALDCGLIISWFAFLTMDMITKHFGPKAATELSIIATGINLCLCMLFFAVSKIPGTWGEAVVPYDNVINTALDNTFGGSWYVIFGSTIAFVVSAFVNNFTNYAVRMSFKQKSQGLPAYLTATYVSTAIGQLVDNLVFSLIVSRVFFGWTLIQCITCAVTGMIIELICEVFFSVLGYKVCEKWQKNKVGEEYLSYRLNKLKKAK